MGTGRRPVHGLCVAVDVHYPSLGGARVAAVVAAEATFARILGERTAVVPEVEAYRPGEFYQRECRRCAQFWKVSPGWGCW
jgi:deoxyinosine 3'endonuclease (endonuclease V)